MEILKPSIQFYDEIDGNKILKKIEFFGRICYQSEAKGNPEKFVRAIINRGHTSVLEHVSLSFCVITNRGVLAEWTRHRIASYSVESTRYCKYATASGASDNKNESMKFIEPFVIENDEGKFAIWKEGCEKSEESYNQMIESGATPQEARQVLNNSLKTMIGCTMNLRSLLNFLSLRCDKAAHPDIKILAISMLKYLQEKIPVVFDYVKYDEQFYNEMLDAYRWRDYIKAAPCTIVALHSTKAISSDIADELDKQR